MTENMYDIEFKNIVTTRYLIEHAALKLVYISLVNFPLNVSASDAILSLCRHYTLNKVK